ncbi:MAG: hypothetical protein QXN68_06345 [Thermoplasmata archaeon]
MGHVFRNKNAEMYYTFKGFNVSHNRVFGLDSFLEHYTMHLINAGLLKTNLKREQINFSYIFEHKELYHFIRSRLAFTNLMGLSLENTSPIMSEYDYAYSYASFFNRDKLTDCSEIDDFTNQILRDHIIIDKYQDTFVASFSRVERLPFDNSDNDLKINVYQLTTYRGSKFAELIDIFEAFKAMNKKIIDDNKSIQDSLELVYRQNSMFTRATPHLVVTLKGLIAKRINKESEYYIVTSLAFNINDSFIMYVDKKDQKIKHAELYFTNYICKEGDRYLFFLSCDYKKSGSSNYMKSVKGSMYIEPKIEKIIKKSIDNLFDRYNNQIHDEKGKMILPIPLYVMTTSSVFSNIDD